MKTWSPKIQREFKEENIYQLSAEEIRDIIANNYADTIKGGV